MSSLVILAILVALPVTLPVTLPSRSETSVPLETERLPVVAPVALVVPIINLPSDSSQPIKAFESLPLSITIPASFVGVPVVPLLNSIKESLTTMLVVSIVVVVPFTVRLPVIVALPVIDKFDEALILPLTSNASDGLVIPIPTSPDGKMVILELEILAS